MKYMYVHKTLKFNASFFAIRDNKTSDFNRMQYNDKTAIFKMKQIMLNLYPTFFL